MIWALTVLIVAVRAEWQCATQVMYNCDHRTAAYQCGIPGFSRISVEMQCPTNDVVYCLYDVIGDCLRGSCTSDCPSLTNNGNTLVVEVRLPDDTCTLTVSDINYLGDVMSSRAVKVTSDCNDVERLDGSGSGYKPDAPDMTMDALMTRPFKSLLIIALSTLVITL